MTAPAVHRNAHDTEIAAAAAVASRTPNLRALVLGLLRDHPDGLTDDEGGRLLAPVVPHADRLTFGRRRHELVLEGVVQKSPTRRRTDRGKSAIVWRLKPTVCSHPARAIRPPVSLDADQFVWLRCSDCGWEVLVGAYCADHGSWDCSVGRGRCQEGQS